MFGKPGNPFELGDDGNTVAKRNSVALPEKMGFRGASQLRSVNLRDRLKLGETKSKALKQLIKSKLPDDKLLLKRLTSAV